MYRITATILIASIVSLGVLFTTVNARVITHPSGIEFEVGAGTSNPSNMVGRWAEPIRDVGSQWPTFDVMHLRADGSADVQRRGAVNLLPGAWVYSDGDLVLSIREGTNTITHRIGAEVYSSSLMVSLGESLFRFSNVPVGPVTPIVTQPGEGYQPATTLPGAITPTGDWATTEDIEYLRGMLAEVLLVLQSIQEQLQTEY